MDSTVSSKNEVLQKALQGRQLRLFRVSEGSVKGLTGPEDTAVFAENMQVLQECARLLGECIGSRGVRSVAIYEGENTMGYRVKESHPEAEGGSAFVAMGAMLNRRMLMRDFLQTIHQSKLS